MKWIDGSMYKGSWKQGV